MNLGTIELNNVKYIASMTKNLISLGSIIEIGNLVIFGKLNCWILDQYNHTHVVAFGRRDQLNGLYCFSTTFQALLVTYNDQQTLWHRRLDQLGINNLRLAMKTNYYKGLLAFEVEDCVCECCLLESQHREHFPKYSKTFIKSY